MEWDNETLLDKLRLIGEHMGIRVVERLGKEQASFNKGIFFQNVFSHFIKLFRKIVRTFFKKKINRIRYNKIYLQRFLVLLF